MDTQVKESKKYRQYSPSSLINAYQKVLDGMSVRGASRQYGVPMQTLRDRVLGKIDPECVTTGRVPLFSIDEELEIVNHLKSVAELGYGYTRAEVTEIATDYAVQLGMRTKNTPLTRNWMDGFLKRWPELKVLRPRSLEIARAKSASPEVVAKYFKELSETISKYNLERYPHLIFNVDEKGVSSNHTPPSVVGVKGYQPPAVTSGKSETTTIIGCGSAAGVAIPPYLVFAGKRWMDTLLVGATPGVSGTVSETGWSNATIFREYLQSHFLRFIPRESLVQHVLLLMDGHGTHVSVGLIDWAKEHRIVLFILPAHTSHVLQPLDVSCYGPFQKMYDNECHKRMRLSASVITKYNICEIVCSVYNKALSLDNLLSGFRKTGIYPTNSSVIDLTVLKPSEVFISCSSKDEISEKERTSDSESSIPVENNDESQFDSHHSSPLISAGFFQEKQN